MLRLSVAIGFQGMLEGVLNVNQEFIDQTNLALTANGPREQLDQFHAWISQINDSSECFVNPEPAYGRGAVPSFYRGSDENMLKIFTASDDDPIAPIHDQLSNYFHDKEHVFQLHFLESALNILLPLGDSGRKTTEENKLHYWSRIRETWDNGEGLNAVRLLIEGYQEELIPGWGNRECDIRATLPTLCKPIARRFNYVLIENGEEAYHPQEGPQGSIEIIVHPLLPPYVPIAAGALQRILPNLIKNTAKARDEDNKQAGDKKDSPPLAFDINVSSLKGNVLITVKDNGPGFDLNVPFPALAQLVQSDPSVLAQIESDISPVVAQSIRDYLENKHPFAIYPITLEQLFQLFL